MKFPKCPDCNSLMKDIYFNDEKKLVIRSISNKARCFYCKPCHGIVVVDLEEEI